MARRSPPDPQGKSSRLQTSDWDSTYHQAMPRPVANVALPKRASPRSRWRGSARYPMQTHRSRSCSHSPSPGGQFAPVRALVNRILSSRTAWPSPTRRVHLRCDHHGRATTWLSSGTSPHGLRAWSQGLPHRCPPRRLGVGFSTLGAATWPLSRPGSCRCCSQVCQYASTCSRTAAAGPRPTKLKPCRADIERSLDYSMSIHHDAGTTC